MKLLAIFLLCLASQVRAQQYRLSYDPSSVPELYFRTNIILEESTNTGYREYRGTYRLQPETGKLLGREFSFDANDIQRTSGQFSFLADIRGEKVRLTLKLPTLTDIRFNLYTDSIKPILNYYVNVEGVYSNGKIYPLTTDQITVKSDAGIMQGMEWIAPANRNFDRVTFTAISRFNPALQKSRTVFLKRGVDVRDEEGFIEKKNSSSSKKLKYLTHKKLFTAHF